MADNPYVNKVQLADGTTLVDLTDTTATANKIIEGYGAYGADGEWIDGTAGVCTFKLINNLSTGPTSIINIGYVLNSSDNIHTYTTSSSSYGYEHTLHAPIGNYLFYIQSRISAGNYVAVSDSGGLELYTEYQYNDTTWRKIFRLTAQFPKTGATITISPSQDPFPVDIVAEPLSVNTNGTYTAPSGTAYTPVTVAVPNSYSASDEGKVVSNGALVAQSSDTVTVNDTYDTTLINSLTVNVPAPAPNLQWKSANYTPATTAQSYSISPDAGYDGMDVVYVFIDPMPSGTAGTPTATKSAVTNNSVTVTPSVTNTAGYISGGTKNGTGVVVRADELISFVTYYTGSSTPASSLGSAGDIYVQV